MALSRARVYGFAFKIETTSGTDAVPDPAVDAVATVGVPTITIDYLEAGTRDDVQTGVLITPDRAPAALGRSMSPSRSKAAARRARRRTSTRCYAHQDSRRR
jgi:hypothetical protein